MIRTSLIAAAACVGLGLVAVSAPPAGAQSSQGLNPATLTETLSKPATNSWPTYAGDYSQRRFSPLTQINQGNVKNLALAWVSSSLSAGPGGGGRGGMFAAFMGGGAPVPTSVGGATDHPVSLPGSSSGTPNIVGSILQVNGILYISSPDNAWAMDARTGTVLWHYWWKSRGGTHIGNRGLAMYGDWLYMETPDDYLVSLDAKTGKERWQKEIDDFNEHYFSTAAPVVVGDHVLVGTGDDLDSPGFLQSFDPTTGALQWKHYLVPMKKGDPGWNTWSSIDAARHGGAMPWIPGSYDPSTHLYIFGTGNPIPAYTTVDRSNGKGETALFTCSIVALNVNTGKMAWYFQTSPNDTHDWDSTQSPVFVDGTWNGKPRKLVMQASRNGYFYVLDRVTGQHLLTAKFSPAANWASGINARGAVIRNPEKDSTLAGSLVSPDNPGSTNWWPPTFDPQTGLFYVDTRQNYAMYYLTFTNPRMLMGLGGKEEDGVGTLGTSIEGIDYHTGKVVVDYKLPGFAALPTGLLTTAGHLLFANDGAGDLVAFDPAAPKPLWHTHIGSVSNGAETYMLDGHQYVIVAGGGRIWAFRLNP